jgi:PadR family transcriptional regulator, regulatory protein PadR
MRFPADWMKGLTPLLVLQTVAEDDLSGLEIISQIKEHGNGIDVPEGTIYPLLYRLEKQGLLSSALRKTGGQRSQRIYHLTDEGRRNLAAEKRRWNQLFASVQPLLGKLT